MTAVRSAALDVVSLAVLAAAAGGFVWLVMAVIAWAVNAWDVWREEAARARRARALAAHQRQLADAPRCEAMRAALDDPDYMTRAAAALTGLWRCRCELPSGHDGNHLSLGAWWSS